MARETRATPTDGSILTRTTATGGLDVGMMARETLADGTLATKVLPTDGADVTLLAARERGRNETNLCFFKLCTGHFACTPARFNGVTMLSVPTIFSIAKDATAIELLVGSNRATATDAFCNFAALLVGSNSATATDAFCTFAALVLFVFLDGRVTEKKKEGE
tara:strand:- start:104 stop:592 length:489 start_codon:yes stop_codon:yes gene_type:complete